MSLVQRRSNIEERLLHRILNDNNGLILCRGFNDKILSYSPYETSHKTCVRDICSLTFCKYSTMSKRIHTECASERGEIEIKIGKILDLSKFTFYHLVFNKIQQGGYDSYKKICNRADLPVGSKKVYNTLCNLITKWRLASGNEHYEMTKGQKRKLKRLAKRAK